MTTTKYPRSGSHNRPYAVELSSETIIAATIVRLEATGEGFRTPLFRAAGAGVLNLAIACNGAPVHARFLKQHSPAVVLVPDDHPDATGPDAWPQARKLARWAGLVALHATGGQHEHYRLFADHAVRCGRLLVVEIELRHLAAWHDLMLREHQPGAVLCLTPRPGNHHPISPAQAGTVLH